MDTSASLLERLRHPGAQAAWGRFVELYSPVLYAWARRLGVPADDAADLVQDVFAVLVGKMADFRYDPQRSFRSWLRTILVNKWRNRLRGRARAPEAVGGPFPEPAAPPAEDFAQAEYREHLVRRALQLMRADFDARTWRACWELVVRGRPAAEVAAELGLTPNAVYLARCRVLRRLREELEGLLD